MARRRLRGVGVVALAGLVLGSLCSEIRAEKVGVTAAVNPDAFSSLGGAPQTQLNIGKSIFYSERINTTGSGLVQVLLVDGSTFTVGPGSDLVIDKFVYDPKKQTGQVVATFSKGVARFVGGKISKNDNGVIVNTPAGALAIRGGMAQWSVNGSKGIFSFLYGKEMTLGGKYKVYEPGYTIDTSTGVPKIRPTTAADVAKIMAALTNGNKVGLSNSGNNNNPSTTFKLVSTQSMNQLISDANTSQILAEVNDQTSQAEPCVGSECEQPPTDPEVPPTDPEVPPTDPEVPPTDPEVPPTDPEVPPTDPEMPPLTKSETGPTGSYASGVYKRGGSGAEVTGLLADVAFNPSSNTVSFGVSNGEAVIIQFDENGNPIGATVTRDGILLNVTPSYVQRTHLITREDRICAGCDFLEWGAWETDLNYRGTGKNADPTTLFAQGWWVKGELTTISDLSILGDRKASATYNGTAWGNVINQGEMYKASGDLEMHWSFGRRSGDLTISNFDTDNFDGGLTFGSGRDGMTQVPTKNEFGGNISGSGMTGSATGSFVNNGPIAAGGVMGKWNVQGTDYQASGVFGGSGTPR